MSTIVAVDPGPVRSAYVVYSGTFERGAIVDNEDLLPLLGNTSAKLVVEMIASYGMPVGATVFETCVWIGRFVQAHRGEHDLVYRKDVKLHLCGSSRAKDSNIRQALIDRFGGDKALGTKKDPGPLYGVKGDVWAALAVAVTYWDTRGNR